MSAIVASTTHHRFDSRRALGASLHAFGVSIFAWIGFRSTLRPGSEGEDTSHQHPEKMSRAQPQVGLQKRAPAVTRVMDGKGSREASPVFSRETFPHGTVTRVLLPCNLGHGCLHRGSILAVSLHALHSGAIGVTQKVMARTLRGRRPGLSFPAHFQFRRQ